VGNKANRKGKAKLEARQKAFGELKNVKHGEFHRPGSLKK
jgi:hypothetical protein